MIGARPAKLQQLSPYSDSGAARNPIIPITANLTARSLQQVQFRRHVDNTLLFRVLETHSKHVDNLNLSSCTAHAQLMHSWHPVAVRPRFARTGCVHRGGCSVMVDMVLRILRRRRANWANQFQYSNIPIPTAIRFCPSDTRFFFVPYQKFKGSCTSAICHHMIRMFRTYQ